MKTTITVSDEIYWQFQEEIPKRRLQQKEAVEEAFKQWIESGRSRSAEEARLTFDLLAAYRITGTTSFRDQIDAMLVEFATWKEQKAKQDLKNPKPEGKSAETTEAVKFTPIRKNR